LYQLITMNYQIELRQLHSFRILSNELHFRKAAEKLYISQPGLTKQIQQLERVLAVKLIERDNRNVRMTAAGDYLKIQIERLDGLLDQTIQTVKNIDAGIEGDIRIGFVGSAMQSVIPPMIKRSNTSMPHVHFQLDEMSNQSQIDALQQHKLDLGFVRLKSVPKGLLIRAIFEEHFSLVVPKAHKISRRGFESIQQFEEESFILFSSDYSSTYYSEIMSIFSDASFRPKVSHKSIHANTIFRLVENGLGVAIVPHSLTKGVEDSIGIKVFQMKNISQRAVLSICWRKDSHSPILNKILIDL